MDGAFTRLTAAGLTLDLDPSIGSLTQRLMAALRTGVSTGNSQPA